MWADLLEYVKSRAKILFFPLVASIATASDVMTFIPLPGWALAAIRIAGVAAATAVLVCLIYGFGKFQQSRRAAEATLAVEACCRHLRYGSHQIDYDEDLVNRLARGLWLRKNHPQWTVARLDADSQCLFLAGGSRLGVIEGLVFSAMKVGNGVACRYRIRAADISEEETRLRPTGFQIRASDQPACFLIDLVDPTSEEIGRPIEMELFVSGILGVLGAK